MQQIVKHISLMLVLAALVSCGNRVEENGIVVSKDTVNAALENANKQLSQIEEEEIEDYIARYGWEMVETGTGLRYLVYKEGSGELIKKGQIVRINFSISLINGMKVYSSDDDGPKDFQVGQAEVESGLHEAMEYLKLGDKAKLIIPSHLAFGLPGDQNKIPKKATLIYDLDVLKVR